MGCFPSAGERESGQNSEKGDKNWGIAGRMAPRRQVYDELEGGLLFREQKNSGGELSLGIKRVLRSGRVWIVVTASLYTGLRLVPIYHPRLSSCFSMSLPDTISDIERSWTS